jgi:hypothetical protein
VRRYILAVCLLAGVLLLALAVTAGADRPPTAFAASHAWSTHAGQTGIADVTHSCPGPCPTIHYPLPATGGAAGAPDSPALPLTPVALLGLALVAGGIYLNKRR